MENRVSAWLSRKRPSPSALRDQRLARFPSHRERAVLERFGATDQLLERVMVEAPEDEYLAARQQRGVRFEAWVLGRRADQGYGTVLDIG